MQDIKFNDIKVGYNTVLGGEVVSVSREEIVIIWDGEDEGCEYTPADLRMNGFNVTF